VAASSYFYPIEKIIASFVIAIGIHSGRAPPVRLLFRVATGISRVVLRARIIRGGVCSWMSRTTERATVFLFWSFVYVRLAWAEVKILCRVSLRRPRCQTRRASR